ETNITATTAISSDLAAEGQDLKLAVNCNCGAAVLELFGAVVIDFV
ncbi:17145_t:CDS:2, partial [Entrophospora sp. SA101]